MLIHAKRERLGDVVRIKAGYPFRGPIEEVRDGPVRAVQMKDIDAQMGVRWHGVIRTQLGGRRQPDWLLVDDLLFVARGARFYAARVEVVPGPAVCGSHLFHMRVKNGDSLLPGFLAWQINQPPFQRELLSAAEGSSQLSVRRPVLESLPVGLPSLEDQQRIVELARLAQRERVLQARLARNRERQFELIAEALEASAASGSSSASPGSPGPPAPPAPPSTPSTS